MVKLLLMSAWWKLLGLMGGEVWSGAERLTLTRLGEVTSKWPVLGEPH